MIGVVYDPEYNVCACSRPRCVCVYVRARARVPVSITSHLSPSVHPSVCLSVDRSVGSPPASIPRECEKERERERTREREMCGRTRVRSLSDPTVGHATEVADPICGNGRNFMSYNGQRTRTRHGPDHIYFARKTWIASERMRESGNDFPLPDSAVPFWRTPFASFTLVT